MRKTHSLTVSHRRLPSLNALRAFEAVAREGSVSAASERLRVSHGAVSKQLRALEAELGVALFERRNRGVFLTDRGRWLSGRLAPTFASLQQIMDDFRTVDPEAGAMTVSCEPTLCLRLLIPALSDLKRETGLEISVLAAGGRIDLRRNNIDVAVRRSDFPVPSDLVATTLAPEVVGPVLSPSLKGVALSEIPLLSSETRLDAWRDWMIRSGVELAGPVVRYEHFYLALQAAEAGQGMAIASAHMVCNAIDREQLYAPFGFIADGTVYRALTRGGANGRSDRFVEWLQQLMATNVSAVAGGAALPQA